MDHSPQTPASQSDHVTTGATADALTREGGASFLVESDGHARAEVDYSFLVRGDIQASSILSTGATAETVTLLEDDTKLVSGSLSGGRDGFVLDGTIVAAEFDDDAPRVTIGGVAVDPSQWPTVTEYMGHGPRQDPVEDPFPNVGELGGSTGDPLHPEEYVIELDADGLDEADAYCFDVDGEVVEHSDAVSVSESGERVFGRLQPGADARIDVRGVLTRIDTAEGIEFTIRARKNQHAAA